MWIVKLALRRPYTFVVMALLILLLGVASIRKTPTDIFPEIDIPVVTVVWQYPGLSPDQMAKQITTFNEYTISSAVDNVKNIESQTLAGVSTIRTRAVKLGRDLGDKVEILSGVDAAEPVVANPNDALREGLEVKVQTQPNPKRAEKK
jgi:multidrug efflux pump subunit AcrB